MHAKSGRTVRDLRRENRTAVLRRLYFDGPMSRLALGPATGLSSGSISNVVAELVAEGLVEEAGSVDSAGGRPRTLLRIAPDSGCMIGVDVGETRVRIELFDLALTELARTERPLAPSGPRTARYEVAVVVDHLRDGIAEVLRTAGVPAERLLGVGIGVPGIVERTAERGAVVHGQTIGWDAVPLERLLREKVALPAEVPYRIENGAKTLGQAEMWFGAGRGAGSAVVVLFGSGVGACVVTDPLGPGQALEWGHLTVRVRGRRCRCGAQGCLEAYAGAEALLARWREAGGEPPAGADEETALTAMLAAAYPADAGAAAGGGGQGEAGPGGVAGDPVALAVLDETAEYLGAGLADLINLFQPERILVGGWAGLQLGSRFLEPVAAYARAYALRHPGGRTEIALGTLGPEAVTVGAGLLPLVDFFALGGRRPERAPSVPAPAWQTALRDRVST
ncbi:MULTISPECIES: ROK family transcriptional regulator [Streptomyces]|uniref:ROK family transcriptional regulator n=2 Tax=Streptomyces TaxID=1883 RepID=A0ABU4K3Y8_9ACTN|nr:ROK family transcriptional regulator [Streptomyces roseolus]MDX2292452.1 ROK family transcriptional regulator [Streptomyces roseolus]